MDVNELLDKYDMIFLVQNECKDELVDKMILYCKEHNKNVLFTYNDEVKKLYTTYEFSDRVKLLTFSNQYGNIFNLVRNGIITLEEAIEALLH